MQTLSETNVELFEGFEKLGQVVGKVSDEPIEGFEHLETRDDVLAHSLKMINFGILSECHFTIKDELLGIMPGPLVDKIVWLR